MMNKTKETTMNAQAFTKDDFDKAMIKEAGFFDLVAESCASRGEHDEKILYQSLAKISRATGINAIADTGCLNRVALAYFTLALHRAGIDSKTANKIKTSLSAVIDMYTADEALKEAKRYE